jgi:hypothetical protein
MLSIFPLWTDPAYGEYVFQLIRYSRACGYYRDFLNRGLMLPRKLLNQGFLVVRLKPLLWELTVATIHLLISCYGICVPHDHGYVPFVIITLTIPHSWRTTLFLLLLSKSNTKVPQVKQGPLTLPERMCSSPLRFWFWFPTSQSFHIYDRFYSKSSMTDTTDDVRTTYPYGASPVFVGLVLLICFVVYTAYCRLSLVPLSFYSWPLYSLSCFMYCFWWHHWYRQAFGNIFGIYVLNLHHDKLCHSYTL